MSQRSETSRSPYAVDRLDKQGDTAAEPLQRRDKTRQTRLGIDDASWKRMLLALKEPTAEHRDQG